MQLLLHYSMVQAQVARIKERELTYLLAVRDDDEIQGGKKNPIRLQWQPLSYTD